MEIKSCDYSEREAIRLQINQGELIERISRAVPEDGVYEVLPGLFLQRASKVTQPYHGISDPALCVIAQGSKEVQLGDHLYHYDPAHYLLATLELPIISEIINASKEQPYLGLRIHLDPDLVGSVIVEAGLPPARKQVDVKALDVSPLAR